MGYKIWACFVQNDFSNGGRQIYNEHYAQVRSLVPADNLLEYHVSEGWRPLCQFLDIEIPSEPFPVINERDGFQKQFRALDRSRWLVVLAQVAP